VLATRGEEEAAAKVARARLDWPDSGHSGSGPGRARPPVSDRPVRLGQARARATAPPVEAAGCPSVERAGARATAPPVEAAGCPSVERARARATAPLVEAAGLWSVERAQARRRTLETPRRWDRPAPRMRTGPPSCRSPAQRASGERSRLLRQLRDGDSAWLRSLVERRLGAIAEPARQPSIAIAARLVTSATVDSVEPAKRSERTGYRQAKRRAFQTRHSSLPVWTHVFVRQDGITTMPLTSIATRLLPFRPLYYEVRASSQDAKLFVSAASRQPLGALRCLCALASLSAWLHVRLGLVAADRLPGVLCGETSGNPAASETVRRPGALAAGLDRAASGR
jgi:hypothetical protein